MSQELNHLKKKTPRTEHISNLVISFPNLKKTISSERLEFLRRLGRRKQQKETKLGENLPSLMGVSRVPLVLAIFKQQKKRCRSFLPCTPQHIKLWTHKVWSQKKETWWIHEVPGDPCRLERFFGYRKTSAAQWVAFKHCPSSTASRLVGERVVLQTASAFFWKLQGIYRNIQYTTFLCRIFMLLTCRLIEVFHHSVQKILLAIKQNFSTCITSPGGSISFISPYLTQIAHPFPSPTKTLVGQSECSHCEALDTLQLLVKLTHVWSLRSKCQHIERRNYVTPQKKGWIVGKKNVSFFLAGLIICLPQNTSGEGKKLKKTENKHTYMLFFRDSVGPTFLGWWSPSRKGCVPLLSDPHGVSGGFFGTLHLIAKQKFNHPCRW